MSKIAFVFPGQGAQYVGMGKEISSEYISSKKIFEEASDTLGFDIEKMIFEGDDETLKITENTQPTILTASVACLAPIIEKGIKPDFVAGLSLGEYSAHVASKTFSFSDAVKIVKKRGKFMQEAVPAGVGSMAAVMGLSEEDVIECCKMAASIGVVEPANLNCPGQIVIAGEIKALEAAMEYCSQKGAKRSILLAVSAPFHCSLLKPAGEKLKDELQNVKINKMEIPVLANATAEVISTEDEVKQFLIRQVSSPVLWEKTINNLLGYGVDTFVEIGPGRVLSGFIKKISREVKTFNIEDLITLDIFLKEMK